MEMIKTNVGIGADDWLYESWYYRGKTYHTMVPPRLGGDGENIKKTWDGNAGQRMAEIMAGIYINPLGESKGLAEMPSLRLLYFPRRSCPAGTHFGHCR